MWNYFHKHKVVVEPERWSMKAEPTKTSHKLAGPWTMAGRTIKLDANVPERYF
jgi:hypothetical protein